MTSNAQLRLELKFSAPMKWCVKKLHPEFGKVIEYLVGCGNAHVQADLAAGKDPTTVGPEDFALGLS
jgi:hypothetical protein